MPSLPDKLPSGQSSQASQTSKTGLAIGRRWGWAIALTFLFAALGMWVLSPRISADRRPLGLMTTLPIYWGEAAGIDEVIAGTAQPHWARSTLEEDHRLIPLDSLAGSRGLASPAAIGRLLLAQPRALSGPENVALDNWVRAGGQLLLFADPMLTGHSRFTIGDRRRPQDVILLSPILARWGLELQFDETQFAGERIEKFQGIDVPVDLAGTFRTIATEPGAPAECKITVGGLVAECTIGRGAALIIADAALLDQDAAVRPRQYALRALIEQAFSVG